MRDFVCFPFNFLAACLFWLGWTLGHTMMVLLIVLGFALTIPATVYYWSQFDDVACDAIMNTYEDALLVKRKQKTRALQLGLLRYFLFPCVATAADAELDEEQDYIVLFHGEDSSSIALLDLAVLLSQKFNVVLVDLPGFGRSKIKKDSIDVLDPVQSMINMLDEFFAALKLPQFILVGHSFGAFLAIHFHNQFPAHIKNLILVDPIGIFPGFGTLGAYWVAIYRFHWLRATVLTGRWGKIMANLFLDNSYPWMVTSSCFNYSHEIIASMLYLGFMGGCWQDTVYDKLSTFTIPVGLIYGQHDSIVPVHQGHALLDHLKFPLHIIENKGHTPFDTHADAKKVAHVILEFVENAPKKRRSVKSVKLHPVEFTTSFNPMAAQDNMMNLYARMTGNS
jgi:pimeloyl-ACP methyl ester carboxylesterase